MKFREALASVFSKILFKDGIKVGENTIYVRPGYIDMDNNPLWNPGKVSGSVSPTDDAHYNLGEATYQWKDLHLSGVAYGTNIINGNQLVDETVDTLQLTDLSVEAAKLGAGAVETAKIANAAITSALIAADQIQTTHIADDQITTPLLVASSVTAAKIAAGSVAANKLDIVDWYPIDLSWTDDTPSAGYVAWSAFTMTYTGSSFSVSAGNSNKKYIYWVYDGATLSESDSKPSLSQHDCMVCVNDGGTANQILQATLIHGGSILTQSIKTTEIATNTIAVGNLASAVTTRMFDSSDASDNIQDWQHGDDLTYIDGGKIYTDTIDADSIVANTIRAAEIAALTITAAEIAADAIIAEKIHAGAVKTAKLDAGAVTSAKITSSQIVGKLLVTDDNVGLGGGPAGIRLDSTQLAGYSGGTTKTFYAQSSDGKLYAGGGNVVLDASGITVKTTGYTYLQYKIGGTFKGGMGIIPATTVLGIQGVNGITFVAGSGKYYFDDEEADFARSVSLFSDQTDHIVIGSHATTESAVRPNNSNSCSVGTSSYYFDTGYFNALPCFIHKFPEGISVLEDIRKIKSNLDGNWDPNTIPKEALIEVPIFDENDKLVKMQKSPNMYDMVAISIRAIQELSEENKKLKRKMKKLETKLR